MQEQERQFRGIWIPSEIWLSENLLVQEKLLLAEIDSFCGNGKACFCSNAHFAKILQVSERYVQMLLSKLESKGLIFKKIVYRDGGKCVEKRFLTINRDAYFLRGGEPQFVGGGEPQFVGGGEPQFVDTNKYIENSNSICEDSSNRGIVEADTEKETIPYTQILRLYNESCPSLAQVRNLSAISSQRKKAIKARYEEWGKSIDPFKECFRRAEASDFLTGRSGKWKATGIDWLLKPSNFSKIMEGAYDNRGKTPAVSTPAENLTYSEMMARQEEERRKRRERDERVISMQG
jgi:hypothetical protein